MKSAKNGNGSGNGALSPSAQAKQTAAQAQHDAPAEGAAETQIEYETPDGMVVGGLPLNITRYAAVFELYSPLYAGHAVVANVLVTGLKTICEVTLNEQGWTDVTLDVQDFSPAKMAADFHQFVKEWQKFHLVGRDYKVAVSNLQTFLADLQIWLQQVELEIRTGGKAPTVGIRNHQLPPRTSAGFPEKPV
jgi:hypothetical protein